MLYALCAMHLVVDTNLTRGIFCAPGEAQKEISMFLGRGDFGEDETIQLSQQRPNLQ